MKIESSRQVWTGWTNEWTDEDCDSLSSWQSQEYNNTIILKTIMDGLITIRHADTVVKLYSPSSAVCTRSPVAEGRGVNASLRNVLYSQFSHSWPHGWTTSDNIWHIYGLNKFREHVERDGLDGKRLPLSFSNHLLHSYKISSKKVNVKLRAHYQ